MIRQPSPMMRLLKWHRDALRDPRLPRHEGIPEAGWYKMRRVKNGPWIPVLIWCEQVIDPETGELTEPERMRADVWGEPADAAEIWTRCRPITKAEYDELVRMRLANQDRLYCDRPVDLGAAPTLPQPMRG